MKLTSLIVVSLLSVTAATAFGQLNENVDPEGNRGTPNQREINPLKSSEGIRPNEYDC